MVQPEVVTEMEEGPSAAVPEVDLDRLSKRLVRSHLTLIPKPTN